MSDSFYCDVCDISCTSTKSFDQHIYGELHNKNIESLGLAKIDSESIECLSSTQRKNEDSENQTSKEKCDTANFTECHNSKIIETIANSERQGLKDFYCRICDIKCTSLQPYMEHSKGSKHKKKIMVYYAQHSVGEFESSKVTGKFLSCDRPNENILDCNIARSVSSLKRKSETLTSLDTGNSEGYFCSTCNIKCTSSQQYKEHFNGIKHQKKSSTHHAYQACANDSICTNLPIFYTREKDKLQHDNFTKSFESTENSKCLSDNEIEGFKDYYCRICNIRCSGLQPYKAHVCGDKHRKKKNFLIDLNSTHLISSSNIPSTISNSTTSNIDGTENKHDQQDNSSQDCLLHIS